jgi:hypothetical protein
VQLLHFDLLPQRQVSCPENLSHSLARGKGARDARAGVIQQTVEKKTCAIGHLLNTTMPCTRECDTSESRHTMIITAAKRPLRFNILLAFFIGTPLSP